MRMPLFVCGMVLAPPLTSPVAAGEVASDGPSARLDLSVVRVAERYPPYADFCRRRPGQCRLDGAGIIPFDERLGQSLRDTSAALNRQIRFALDREIHAVEDYWTLPVSGYGDCEDLALAKRAALVGLGYPSAALRLAFVFHRRELSSHCVLTVESTAGTFVLDSDTDQVRLWHETPYNFEARERADGRWERYDQRTWRFNGWSGDSQ